MAATPEPLYTGQPGTGDTLLYTSPGSTTTVVTGIHACNTDGVARKFTLGLRSGGALAEANHFVSDLELPPNGTYDWEGHQNLLTGETIRGLQANATGITLHISGVKLT